VSSTIYRNSYSPGCSGAKSEDVPDHLGNCCQENGLERKTSAQRCADATGVNHRHIDYSWVHPLVDVRIIGQ
jgi:hypothetical protein